MDASPATFPRGSREKQRVVGALVSTLAVVTYEGRFVAAHCHHEEAGNDQRHNAHQDEKEAFVQPSGEGSNRTETEKGEDSARCQQNAEV